MHWNLLFQVSDLTEIGRTRPERAMSGVVRGVAESFVPEKTYPWGGGEYIVCAAIDTVLYMYYSVLVIVIQYSTAEVFCGTIY